MGKREKKLGHAAHVKRHTVGTSNEISFSVLEAAKNKLDGSETETPASHSSRFGGISLFTLPLRRKKKRGTPTKEKGLPLSNGEFASVDSPSPAASIGTIDVGSPQAEGLAGSATAKRLLVGIRGNAAGASAASPAAPSLLARSAEEEIAHRKNRRRVRRVVVAVCGVTLCFGLVGAGGWYLYQNYQTHLSQVEVLNNALHTMRTANETVLQLDELVANPLDSAHLETWTALSAKLPEARTQLDEVDQTARALSVDLKEPQDKEAANQTVVAVAGRVAMLDNGEQIMQLAQQANSAAERLRLVWQEVIKADSQAREAAVLVANTTNENVAASKEKTAAAAAAFAAAQNTLENIASDFPHIEVSALENYVAKRLEAMGYASASDEALLARNVQEAAAQNDAYNAADAEAVALAANIPQEVTQLAIEVFRVETEKLLDTYSAARSQAGSADAFLRDYLGTNSK